MAAGVTAKLWEVSDIVAIFEAWKADKTAAGTLYKVEPAVIAKTTAFFAAIIRP